MREWGKVIMGLEATLPNHIPACRSELVLSLTSNGVVPDQILGIHFRGLEVQYHDYLDYTGVSGFQK